MATTQKTAREQWEILSKNDWGEILEFAQKKAFQRKFQIVEAFVSLVAAKGIQEVSYNEIAKQCSTTRQLVEHHFPDRIALILLSYRFLYARLQKAAADAIVTRQGFLAQFKAYIEAVGKWIMEFPEDNRFLVQVYATAGANPEVLQLFQRNSKIGNERLTQLFKKAKDEGFFQKTEAPQLAQYANSIQYLLIGYAILSPAMDRDQTANKQLSALWESCLALLSLQGQRQKR